MMIRTTTLTIVLAALLAGVSYGQRRPTVKEFGEQRAAKGRLVALISLVRASKCASAAGYIVYRGNDTSRRWADTCNYADPEERKAVDALCARIAGYVEESAGYSVMGYRRERESEGEWLIVQVTFQVKGAVVTRHFAFLRIHGEYCLGDID